MTKNRYMLINATHNVKNYSIIITHQRCVEKCDLYPGYKKVINYCVFVNASNDPDAATNRMEASGVFNFFEELANDFSICWPHILLICFAACVFSYLVLIMLRHITAFVVWFAYSLLIITFVLISAYTWFLYLSLPKEDNGDGQKMIYLGIAIVVSIFTIIAIGVFYRMRNKIKLVIQLFKEASKTLIDMPQLIFEPIIVRLMEKLLH